MTSGWLGNPRRCQPVRAACGRSETNRGRRGKVSDWGLGQMVGWAFLLSLEIFLNALFSDAKRAGQGNSREIIIVETRDVLLVSAGDELLGLNDLDRVGDAGGEAVARLSERFFG